MGQLIAPAPVDAEVLSCDEGLSFWGGIDPDTGRVIDAHHPLCGRSVAGKVLVMPTSRGSCSGSGVLLQLALNGCAPAALVFCEDEEVLTLGALIAAQMFDRQIGVIRLSRADHAVLSGQEAARLDDTRLSSGTLSRDLRRVSDADLDLSPEDRAMLGGAKGAPVALAMRVLSAMAAAQGAQRLISVTRGHIDGCIYAHEANLIFAERMAEMGAQVAIPCTINAISVDRARWAEQGVPSGFGQSASRLADAYVRMGARPSFTCAPYFAPEPPRLGETIGWSESNAVIYANSVLGARTAKHPDYLDLFIAMTGRAPETGVYLDQARRPQCVLEVDLPDGPDDALWPLLGWVAGRVSPDKVPVLTGLETADPSKDDLRALCAAFGTTSAAPMLHVAGVTPEADVPPVAGAERLRISRADLAEAWAALNTGPEAVDLVAIGSPHASANEVRALARHLHGQRLTARVIVTLGREVRAQVAPEVAALQALGVTVYSDLCWCSITPPLFPVEATTLMTNSGKYAHYAPGLSGRAVRFGSRADCAKAAVEGQVAKGAPRWLR